MLQHVSVAVQRHDHVTPPLVDVHCLNVSSTSSLYWFISVCTELCAKRRLPGREHGTTLPSALCVVSRCDRVDNAMFNNGPSPSLDHEREPVSPPQSVAAHHRSNVLSRLTCLKIFIHQTEIR